MLPNPLGQARKLGFVLTKMDHRRRDQRFKGEPLHPEVLQHCHAPNPAHASQKRVRCRGDQSRRGRPKPQPTASRKRLTDPIELTPTLPQCTRCSPIPLGRRTGWFHDNPIEDVSPLGALTPDPRRWSFERFLLHTRNHRWLRRCAQNSEKLRRTRKDPRRGRPGAPRQNHPQRQRQAVCR